MYRRKPHRADVAGNTLADWRIRSATEEDFPAVMEMCRKFFDSTGYSDIAQFDPDSMAVTLLALMRDGVLLVVEKNKLVGMAGAIIYPFYFNLGHKTSQEMFWWVDPEHRGIGRELFAELKNEVKKKGASSLSMIAVQTSPHWVGDFYMSHGLRPSERSYIGRL